MLARNVTSPRLRRIVRNLEGDHHVDDAVATCQIYGAAAGTSRPARHPRNTFSTPFEPTIAVLTAPAGSSCPPPPRGVERQPHVKGPARSWPGPPIRFSRDFGGAVGMIITAKNRSRAK